MSKRSGANLESPGKRIQLSGPDFSEPYQVIATQHHPTHSVVIANNLDSGTFCGTSSAGTNAGATTTAAAAVGSAGIAVASASAINSGRHHVGIGVDIHSGLPTPLLHNVPKSILPIINRPFKVKDFFTDLTFNADDAKIHQQIQSIIKYFPPPPPNFIPPELNKPGGSMIPFIFPPPPPQLGGDKDTIQIIPPLPFPPPNYMPYPLVSENATLTPQEVFSSFLDALEKLPRIDMVVASAAGSLYDMRAQANEEGFAILDHENEKSKRLEALENGDDEDDEDDEDDDADDADTDLHDNDHHTKRNVKYLEYLEFASSVDTSNLYDSHDIDKDGTGLNRKRTFSLPKSKPENYGKVNSQVSNVKSKSRKSRVKLEDLDEYSDLLLSSKPFRAPAHSRFSRRTPGGPRDKRVNIQKTLGAIKDYESKHQEELYLSLKRDELAKIKRLNESKIFFNGEEKFDDEELNQIKTKLEERRDYDLVGLKIMENYNLLNNSLMFYQDSNRMYKQMNSLFMNKLLKLKNFFEYQRDLFSQQLDAKDTSLFDVKSKESAKLFAGISQKDISTYLREQIINRTNSESIQSLNSFNKFTPTAILLVHDFMPLITEDEFNLITGDLPTHKYKTNNDPSQSVNSTGTTSNIKHQIFKSSLYDPMTSGSDTNGSDTATANTAPKRRGRRANNANANANSNGGNVSGVDGSTGTTPISDKLIDGSDKGSSKYSETVLMAKIMKHYVPPQGIRPDELMSDLEKMGLQSRWPTK